MQDIPEYTEPAFWEQVLQSDPREGLATIERLMDDDRIEGDARVLALRAAARCHFELGQMDEALRTARSALDRAHTTTTPEPRRLAAMTAAIVFAEVGNTEAAIDELEMLRGTVDGAWLGRVHLQKACVLMPAGRTDEAILELDASAALLDAVGDAADRWRVYYNRGYARLQLGRFDDAEADYRTALDVAESAALILSAAQTHASLGVLAGRSRRLRQSLEHFERAADRFDQCGRPGRAVLWTEIDQSEVLMHSGLSADAVLAARSAMDLAVDTGNVLAQGDAQLVVARAELSNGSYRDAERSARLAADLFADSGRTDLQAHAIKVEREAGLLAVRSTAECAQLLSATDELVARLAERGWNTETRELRFTRVLAAARFDLLGIVSDDLAALRELIESTRGDALAGWFARSLTLRAQGSLPAAREAAIEGVDLVDGIVAEATGLAERSAAMSIGHDLSRLVIEFSIEMADADTVFAAAEGTRARALHDELGERGLHRTLTEEGASRLGRDLADRLRDRTLIEWVVTHDRVWAVVVDTDRRRLVEVGPISKLRHAADRVMTWLDIAAAEPDESSERARIAFERLDDLLMRPLGLAPDTPVVIVPDGFLYALPWSGLTTCAHRPTAIAPSAQLWLDAERRTGGPIDRVGVIIGPDVDLAAAERRAVREIGDAVEIDEMADATAGVLRRALQECGLVHVGAHGQFRSDRPLLSTIQLDDGDAPVDSITPDHVTSRLVMLSSCEGGASGTSDGSEVLGIAAVFLARGAGSVVSPLTIVRDLECAEFVAEIYARMADGSTVGDAMTRARSHWLRSERLGRVAVAASFMCLGSTEAHLAS